LALNKVKIPGIVSLSMGIVNLVLALLFPLVFDWGLSGVAAAGAVVLTLKNAIFTPLYGAKILEKPWHTFINSLFPGLVAAILIALLSFGLSSVLNQSNWLDLIISFGIITLAYASVVFFAVLSSDERRLLLFFMPEKR
jgi:membrane protein EpsK